MRLWVLCVALAACATVPTRRVRRRPSVEAVQAAFEVVTPAASRCLGADDRVTVEGFFDGVSGQFLVERIGVAAPSTPVRVQQCVSVAMEGAQVRPFGAGRHDAQWTVAPPSVSASVRAMMRERLSVQGVEVAGEIDPAAVMTVLRGEALEARRCYEDALRGDASLAGRLEVRFTLSVDGRMTHAVASGAPGFRAVGHCILGRLRLLRWPLARGAPVDFVFPYRFTPQRVQRTP